MGKKVKIGRMRFRGDLIKKNMVPNSNADSLMNTTYDITATRDCSLKDMGDGAMYHTTRNIEDIPTHRAFFRYEDQFNTRGKNDHIRIDDQLFKIIRQRTIRERGRFIMFLLREKGQASEFNIVP